MSITKINIGEDFSKTPRGRYHPADGKNSGERFREEFLKKVFSEPDKYTLPVEVVLDDAEGYGSSFLEEAFGGLVRKGYATAEEVIKAFEFTYKDEDFSFYKRRIKAYIREAKHENGTRLSTDRKCPPPMQ